VQAYILVDGTIERTGSADAVREAHAAGRRMWIDLGQRSASSDALLTETFHLHPLVVEDIWLDRTTPKIDDYDDYLYLAIHGPRRAPEGAPTALELWVLDIVMGATFVITQHGDGTLAEAIAAALERSPRLLAEGPAWLVHALLDHVVDRYLWVMEILERRLDRLERDVVSGAGDGHLMPTIFSLKRSIQELCRITVRQRQLLERLSGGALDEIPRAALPYYRDVNDHFGRVADRAESYRDVILNTLDAYLGLQSNRMNRTIQTLTLMSTVMLPLNLIAGIYGMNFRHMPELFWPYGYPFALGLMAVVAGGILLLFRRKRWL
jgi:magnesium transporter